MPVCVAFGCSNRSTNKPKHQLKLEQTGKKITFHRFPKKSALRKKWIQAIHRKNWSPTSCSCVCSLHFRETELDRTSRVCVRLRDGAIPSIFSHKQKIIPEPQSNPLIKSKSRQHKFLQNQIQLIAEPIKTIEKQPSTHSALNLTPCLRKNRQPKNVQSISTQTDSTSISPKQWLSTFTKDLIKQTFKMKQKVYKIKLETLQMENIKKEKTIDNLKSILKALKG